tara:strand:+ start:931 stop:1137 length:207 start_codon:yes stop_codon:yes gene_type:complete
VSFFAILDLRGNILLVLSRRRDQTLVIGDNVEVTVLEIKGGQVRLGISAPKAVPVHRGEIHAKVIEKS